MQHNRLLYLNGLRGILAVIVFVHHFLYAFCPDVIFGGNPQQFLSGEWTAARIFGLTPLNILHNPATAINFFFLLSGYVQSYHYFKTNDLCFVQRSFIKRYFRLMLPTLFVVLLVFIFHRLHLINKNIFPQNNLNAAWIKSMLPDDQDFFGAVKFGVTTFFSKNSSYYQVLWTMPIELYNSLMVLILLLVTHNIKRKIPFIVFWLLVQLFVLQSFYAVSFTLGMLVCLLDSHYAAFKKIMSNMLLKWLCLLLGLYFASYPFMGYVASTKNTVYSPISFFENFPAVVSYAFGNLLLFLLILNAPRIQKILSKSILQFFGDISFMFYLLHFLIIFSFSAWLYQTLVPHVIVSANLAITALASFALISLASYLLYKFVDLPVVKLCNTYSKKIFGL